MTAQVKNAKFFKGRDGYGMNATLYVDGKRTTLLYDAGDGGSMSYHVLDAPRFKAFEDAIEKFPPYFVEEMGLEIKLSTDLFISVLHDAQECGKTLKLLEVQNA